MTLVNGVRCDEVTVTDRGLQYGDGVFETLAVRDGTPALWERHLQRLRRGCERLGMAMPDSELLWAESARLCAGAERTVLKLIVTRGPGGRGYRPPEEAHPTRILSLRAWPDHPETWWRSGVAVTVCRHRLPLNPALAGFKHLNRLDQIIASREWNDRSIAEGLMLDTLDRVIEGTMTNIFIVREGRLYTPDLKQSGIEGVMRGWIMELAVDHGISCTVTALTLADLAEADELFLCNSVIGIWPVQSLGVVAIAAPGPVTQRLSRCIPR